MSIFIYLCIYVMLFIIINWLEDGIFGFKNLDD